MTEQRGTTRRWLGWLWRAVTGALGVIAAVSAFVAAMATSPNGVAVGQPPADWDLVPISFTSEDDSQIVGWITPPGGDPAFVVVLGHGLNGTRRSMLSRARLYRERGAAVLVFDFRGHGESEQTKLTFGWREAGDLLAAVAAARDAFPDRPVIVHGISLGSAAAIIAGERLSVDGYVLESPYADLREAVRARGERVLPFGGRLAADILLLHTRWAIGCSPGAIRPIDHAAELRAPTLFLAGGDDLRAPLAGIRRMSDLAPGSRGVIVFDGAIHEDLRGYDLERFNRAIEAFLDGLGLDD